MGVLRLLHSLVDVDFIPFINDFHPKMEVILNLKKKIFALDCSTCLFSDGFSLGTVYKFLRNRFV
jgi:hypothetical protein